MSKQILMAVLVGGLAVACGDDDNTSTNPNNTSNPTNNSTTTNNETNGPEMPAVVDPSADTQAVLDSIQGYESWPILGENTTPVQSQDHMGMFVVTRRNDVFGDAMTDGSTSAPVGSIIVKENYMNADDPMPMALTIMAKPDDTEWYWVQSMPNGKVMLDPMGNPMEGKDVGMCVGCHSQASDNDFVFLHTFATE